MKRGFVLIISMIVCLSAVIVISQIYMHHSFDEYKARLTAAETYAKENHLAEAKEEVIAIKTKWEKESKIFKTYIRHNDIEMIDQMLVFMEVYLTEEDMEEFLAHCALVQFHFKHILDTEKVSIENIL